MITRDEEDLVILVVACLIMHVVMFVVYPLVLLFY